MDSITLISPTVASPAHRKQAAAWREGVNAPLEAATRIHDRRPLALGVNWGREWIEQLPPSEGSVVARAVPAAKIIFHPVSTAVSSPRKDGPELIEPVAVRDGPSQVELL